VLAVVAAESLAKVLASIVVAGRDEDSL